MFTGHFKCDENEYVCVLGRPNMSRSMGLCLQKSLKIKLKPQLNITNLSTDILLARTHSQKVKVIVM